MSAFGHTLQIASKTRSAPRTSRRKSCTSATPPAIGGSECFIAAASLLLGAARTSTCPMSHRRMQHPTRVPLLLTVLVLVALAGADAAASRRQVPQGFLGVDAEGPMGTTGVNVAGEFGTMARTGVESVRLPLYWSLAQPTAE